MNSPALNPSPRPPPSPSLNFASKPGQIYPQRLWSRGNPPAFLSSHLEISRKPGKINPRNPGSNRLPVSRSAGNGIPSVGDKVRILASEFKALPSPIDRVKRLLHYATLLPPSDESGRVRGNRVMGCTTQVWLEARMDGEGRMRFKVDSDSEITKGFSSCLIWLLDGAAPPEVLGVAAEDLAAVNVAGFPSKVRSRVNTWHNVLIGMQKKTMDCVGEGEIAAEFTQIIKFQSLLI
ncbi:unnamed protein product [Cuscuta campestris]|uniref:Fe-S metabolism associated domain-containing protein n=1 Tax=Cuscuta campestris TaxID=132261 RepID=A0A484MME3_9ASTE|nr:unnamed protein product [Cuscuta campestris]